MYKLKTTKTFEEIKEIEISYPSFYRTDSEVIAFVGQDQNIEVTCQEKFGYYSIRCTTVTSASMINKFVLEGKPCTQRDFATFLQKATEQIENNFPKELKKTIAEIQY